MSVSKLPVSDRTKLTRQPERQARERERLHAVLDAALIAHVGVVRDGHPVVLPFACARDGDALLLHGSSGGGLLRLCAEGNPIVAAVTHLDGVVVASTTFESSMNYRSAVVHGVPEVLEGDAKLTALDTLSDHLLPGRMAEVRSHSRKELAATLVLRLSLDEASVKVRTGPPDDSENVSGEEWVGVLPMYVAAAEPVPYGSSSPDAPPSVRAAAARLTPDAALAAI